MSAFTKGRATRKNRLLTAEDLKAVRLEIIEGVVAIAKDLLRRGDDVPTAMRGGTEMTFSGQRFAVAYVYCLPEQKCHVEIAARLVGGRVLFVRHEIFQIVDGGFEVTPLRAPDEISKHLANVILSCDRGAA